MQAVLAAAVVALAVAVGIAWGRRTRPPARPGQPIETPLPEAGPIAASWWAARDGKADAYLACFAEPFRTRLEADLAAQGREAFEQDLRARAEAALAVEFGPPERCEAARLVFPVTVQHERDAELLDYVVVREGTRWKIADVVPRGRVPVAPPCEDRLAPPAEEGEPK